MHTYPYLFRAMTTTLILASSAAAAVAEPADDALAAWRRGEYTTAYRIWAPMADQGDPDAQFYLGVMNEHGQGVARNSTEATNWYRKAADQQNALAQFSLGMMYANGEGVPHSYSDAARWYRLAADEGLGGAQFNLGIMYTEGKGVPQDQVLAHVWLDLAVSELRPLGRDQHSLAVDALDLVTSKMSATEIAEARQLALEWTIEHRCLVRQRSFAVTLR